MREGEGVEQSGTAAGEVELNRTMVANVCHGCHGCPGCARRVQPHRQVASRPPAKPHPGISTADAANLRTQQKRCEGL